MNAKVVLLGDTGVGKSGLGLVLSGQDYQPTDSTHGRRVWAFDAQEVDAPGAGRQTREVLLWDLAGQPGYRLVHQLHLNEVAVALMVFDSRSETDPFAGVKHWVRALAQARRLEQSAVPLRAYLVAARALPDTVVRRAIRSCPECGYVLPDDLVRGKLKLGMTTTRCPLCEKSTISLLDSEPTAQSEAVTEMNRSADEHRDRNVAALRIIGKAETGDYDVFMCHNSKDKAQVMAIGERLKERGVLPWLDVWEIRPGMRWQRERQRNIKSVKSAAVFIGARGTGPWQELEVESILQQFAKRNRPDHPRRTRGQIRQPPVATVPQLMARRRHAPPRSGPVRAAHLGNHRRQADVTMPPRRRSSP